MLVASAGGESALLAVLGQLPAGFDVPVLVMQHLPPESNVVDIYARRLPIDVVWARDGMRLASHTILVCPPRNFAELLPDGTLRLSPCAGAVERPMDMLLRSVARSFGHHAIAVVLTGMGSDAAAGALELHRADGRVLVQSESTAEHPDMPRAAIAAGAAYLVAPLQELGRVIAEVVAGTPRAQAPSELEAIARVFDCRGEVARLACEVDWLRTPLGPVLNWPPHQRMAVRMVVENPAPMCLSWGPQLVQIYNDAFVCFMGAAKHPRALGRPARENWPEIWDSMGTMFELVMTAGQPASNHDTVLEIHGGGAVEELFATIDHAPVRNPADGAIDGVLTRAAETTGIVLAARRMRLLRELAMRTAGAATPQDACQRAAAALSEDAVDLAFVLIYLVDKEQRQGALTGAAGLDPCGVAAPLLIHIAASDVTNTWPLQRALAQPLLLDGLGVRFVEGAAPAHSALLLPFSAAAGSTAAGVLVAGLNPHRPLDEDGRAFVDLVAQQLASAITEARARQMERERIEQLADMDRTKTEFFANVSHEFRTPLTLLLTPLEEMLRQQNALPPALVTEIDTAARNSRRLLRLVNDLLDFSEIETRRQRAPLEFTDLCELTQDVASAFRSAIERAVLRFEVNCDPALPLLPVNRDMWEKIVSNLLSNALKFTFEGAITVTLKSLSLHAELSIADSGVGIPEQELPNIFKRFHRVRGTRARTVEGSGMGLAIVHDLVARMGGQLTVRSREGKGTSFTVWMPFKAGRQSQEHAPVRRAAGDGRRVAADLASEAAAWVAGEDANRATLEEPLGLPNPQQRTLAPGARVLVADDNADMRDYLRRLLGAYWHVRVVADGAEALAAARETRPDLILADIMMPRMDGLELLRTVREDETLSSVPMIFLTARAGEDTAIESLLAGADDYLAKPFSARELIARVGGQIELARARSRAAEFNEFLVRFTDEIRATTDPTEMARTACRLVHARLGVDRVYWSEVDWAAREWFTVGEWRAPDIASITGRYALDAWQAGTSWLLRGQQYVVDDIQQDPRLNDAVKEACASLRMGACLALPVMVEGKLRSFLAVDTRTPRDWTPDEIALVDAVAGRCWAEVERARAERALRESEAKFRTVFETMGQGYADVEMIRGPDGRATDMRYLELNPQYERLTGFSVAKARGRTLREMIPDVDNQLIQEYDRILRSGRPAQVENDVAPLGKWYEANIYPRGGDRFSVLYEDITVRKKAEEALREREKRQSFLLKLSDALRAEIDADAVAHRAIRMLADEMELDRCYITLYRPADDEAVFPYQVGNDTVPPLPSRVRLSDFPEAYAEVLDKTFVVEDDFERRGLTPAERANSKALGMRAMVASTVRRGERNPISSMAAVSSRPRRWTDGEIALVEETAERTWAAMERALAESALRESEERRAFLLRLADAVRPLQASAEIQGEATRLLREHLAAGWCYYVEWDEPAARGVVLRDAAREGLPSLAGAHDVSDVPEFLDLIRKETMLNVGDYTRFDGLSPALRARYTALGFRSMLVATLVKQGHLVASMIVGNTEVCDAWSSQAEALLMEVAERTWAAVERGRAEGALRESEEKYRTLFERMDEGFALCELVRDREGRAVDYRYVDLNPALVRHGGITPDSLRGRRATEFFPDLDPWLIETYARVVETGKSVLDEHYFPHVDRWLRINAFPRGGNLFAVLFGDITERKRAEEGQRVANERLQEGDRRKDEFLATLAHELRNPLAPISNALQVVRHPDGKRRADRLLVMVERQVRHMVRLVDDLMEASRISRGKVDLQRAPVALAAVLHAAVETSQPAFDQKHHQLTVAVPDETLKLDADRDRLTQVFTNLLNNAAKYTPPVGRSGCAPNAMVAKPWCRYATPGWASTSSSFPWSSRCSRNHTVGTVIPIAAWASALPWCAVWSNFMEASCRRIAKASGKAANSWCACR